MIEKICCTGTTLWIICEQCICIEHLAAHPVRCRGALPGCPCSPPLSGCFSVEFITAAQRGPWELLCKWGEMGRDENPESVEQWDLGFKSVVAISKAFYSWRHARCIYWVSGAELERDLKGRFVGRRRYKNFTLQAFYLWRKKTAKAPNRCVCSLDEEGTENQP